MGAFRSRSLLLISIQSIYVLLFFSIQINTHSFDICQFSTSSNSVQSSTPTFTLNIGISPSSAIGMKVIAKFPDSYWINQITPAGTTTLTPTNTPLVTVTNVEKTIGASTFTISFSFTSYTATSFPIFNLQFAATSNPYYSKASYINCELYDSSNSYATPVANSPTNTAITAPNLVTFVSSGSNGENTVGGTNIVNIYFTRTYSLYSTNQITISGLSLLGSCAISSITTGGAAVTYTGSADCSGQTTVITLGQDLLQSTSTVLIKITNVQSSKITKSNSGSISFTTSIGNPSTSQLGIGSAAFTWQATTIASITIVSVNGNPSRIVGATNNNLFFSFRTPFDIDSSHLFALSYQSTSSENMPTISTNAVYIMNGINTQFSCASCSCLVGNSYCNFGLSSGTLVENVNIDMRWYSFTNFASARPQKFLFQISDGLSISNVMAQGTFDLTDFQPSSISNIGLAFSTPTGNYNNVLTTTEYTLTMTPATAVPSVVYVIIYIPTAFDLPTTLCNSVSNPTGVICTSVSSPSKKIYYQMASGTTLSAGSAISTIKFNMKNPICGGANSFTLKVDTYNYISSVDSTTPGIPGYLSGTGSNTISLTYTSTECSSKPSILTPSTLIVGETADYEINFSGCTTPTPLQANSIFYFTFPSSYNVPSTITCEYKGNSSPTYTSLSTSLCYVTSGTKVYLSIPSVESLTPNMYFKIKGVTNPNLPGPQDNFVFSVNVGACEMYYMSFDASNIIITNTLPVELSTFEFSMGSSQNLAITPYTFKIQICNLCLISQSTKVTALFTLVWDSSFTSGCGCTPTSSTMPITESGTIANGCSYTFGTNQVANSLYTFTLGSCTNPNSVGQNIIVTGALTLRHISLLTTYNGYSDTYTTNTITAYTIQLDSAKSFSTPSFPSYLITSSSYYLKNFVIKTGGKVKLELFGMHYQSQNPQAFIKLYDSNNALLAESSPASGSGRILQANPITLTPSTSSLPSDFIVTTSNWVYNFDTVVNSNVANYGISVSTLDANNKIMGQAYIKPSIICDFPCKTCSSSATSTCLSCYDLAVNGNQYYKLWKSGCYLSCNSIGTNYEAYESSQGICSPCINNCIKCNSDSTQCTSCKSDFVLIGTSCSGSTSFLAALQSGKLAPFPFFCATLALIFIAIAGYIRDQNSYILANILISVAPLYFVANIVQIFLCLSYDGKSNIVFEIISVACTIILNVLFGILFCRNIKPDKGYIQWSQIHTVSTKFIYIFGYGFSFHVYRLLYSRFLGFDIFACKLTNYPTYFRMINTTSIIFMALGCLVVFIGDIIGFINIPWTNQLNINMIETFALSLFIIILSIVEFFKYRYSTDRLIGISPPEELYTLLKENNSEYKRSLYKGRPVEEEPQNQKSVSWTKLPISMSQEEKSELRQIKSDPPSPKTLKNIKIKFKKNRINENVAFQQSFFDNVYYDANPNPIKSNAPQEDFSQQTIPFEKIRNFRRMMRLQDELDRIRKNKMKPTMEIIAEEDYSKKMNAKGKLEDADNLESDHRPGIKPENGTLEEKKPGDGEIVIGIQENSPRVEKNTGELLARDRDKMIRDNDKFGKRSGKDKRSNFYDEGNAPGAIDRNNALIDDNELLGSFERDEAGTILIIQDKNGNLLDKKGRKVNKHGYLVDDKGNILNKKGELIYNADEIDFGEILQEPGNQNAKPDIPILKNSEDKIQPTDEEICSRRSDPVDPMMEDKPSNYDDLNMRNDPEIYFKNVQMVGIPIHDYENAQGKTLHHDPSLNVSNFSEQNQNKNTYNMKEMNLEENKNNQVNTGFQSKASSKAEFSKKYGEDDILAELNIPQKKAIVNEEMKAEFQNAFPKDINGDEFLGKEDNDPLRNQRLISHPSKTSLAGDSDKIKTLEKVYLQRLENANKKGKSKPSKLDERGNSLANPKDNLSEMIDSNYNEMQKKFVNSISPKKVGGNSQMEKNNPNIFTGNRALYS